VSAGGAVDGKLLLAEQMPSFTQVIEPAERIPRSAHTAPSQPSVWRKLRVVQAQSHVKGQRSLGSLAVIGGYTGFG
jgi:hypothetical protein